MHPQRPTHVATAAADLPLWNAPLALTSPNCWHPMSLHILTTCMSLPDHPLKPWMQSHASCASPTCPVGSPVARPQGETNERPPVVPQLGQDCVVLQHATVCSKYTPHATRDALHRAQLMHASQTRHLSHPRSLTAKLELHVELVLLLVLRQTRHHTLDHLARGGTRGQTHRVPCAVAAGGRGSQCGRRASETREARASCVRVADASPTHLRNTSTSASLCLRSACMNDEQTHGHTRVTHTTTTQRACMTVNGLTGQQ